MPHTATLELLAQLEPLTHKDRTLRMLEFGKSSKQNAVLADLEAGTIFERRLALITCFSSRDSARVKRGLLDASKVIRALAISLAPMALSDTDLLEVLRVLPRKMRSVLLHAFARRKRFSLVVDQFFEELLEHGNTKDASAMLGFVSSSAIEKHASLLELVSAIDLNRLAREQAGFVADWLEQQALVQTDFNPRLVWQTNAVIEAIFKFSAPRALQLLKAVRRTTSLDRLQLQSLVGHFPKEIASLQLSSEDKGNLEFSFVAHRLSLQQVLELQQLFPSTLQELEMYFKRFGQDARVKVFQAFRGAWTNDEGLIEVQTLCHLPKIVREQEAKRHLEHPILVARPLQRLPYAKLLGWDEASAILEPAIKHPKPEQRIAAVPALIHTARYERKYTEVLKFARFRKNEQDPVRLVMLNALADLPPSGWKLEHLEILGQVLQDALNAADLSHSTALAAERLVVRLLPFQMVWAANWVGLLVKERGQINVYQIGQQLSDVQAQALSEALLPVLKAWATREREGQIINLLFQFGKRLKVLPGFLEIAEGLVRQAVQVYTSQSALSLIAVHDKPRFNALVPEILKDKSWATVPVVYQHLHLRRQDLLTSFLGQTAYKGRFSTGKTRFVLPLRTGFHRWNSSQQILFVQTLGQVTRDQSHSIPSILQVLLQLPAIPNAAASTIERLASLKNTRLAIRDAALRALARLDEARGLEPLLAALEDDRARIAIYALRRLLLSMPPEQALNLLKNTPLERVTVGKEVLRLIAELGTESAYSYLLEANTQNLHRDVRVALLRGLWDYLEKPKTWEVFLTAARDVDPAIADAVIRIPTERLSGVAQANLIVMLASLMLHPDPEVRLETLRRCSSIPVADPTKLLVQPLLTAIRAGIPDQTKVAARALFATYSSLDADVIRQVFLDILPERRILRTVTDAFLEHRRALNQKSNQVVLEALKTDVLTLNLQTEVVLSCFSATEIARFFVDLNTQGQFQADVYSTALRILENPETDRTGRIRLGITELEQTWREHPNELLRRLGLAVLIFSASNNYGEPTQWQPAQLELLELYRQDPSNLVAAAAQFTFPTAELEQQNS